jgi:hypothetical protein
VAPEFSPKFALVRYFIIMRGSKAAARKSAGPGTPEQKQTTVDVSFAANRDQLFAAWNAIANLADMSVR